MSYKFEAEPRVVQSRSKFRAPGIQGNTVAEDGSSHPNIVKDNRVRVLTPAQQEREYVRIEKDKIKIENMHKQLLAFKKSKKMNPYDIRPSTNPKVDPNLNFFLTDSTDVRPATTNTDAQTDTFKERPKSPPYVPKKTGRDVSTQVEDNELFNFDREVTPIVDVIVTKTLEQTMVEIEEEEEIHRIRTFKSEYWKRRQEDEQKWKEMLQKELDLIAAKDKRVEEYLVREERRINVLRKLQTYQVAHLYLRDLRFNTMSFLWESGLYQNQPREELVENIPPFLVNGVVKTLTNRRELKNMMAHAFTHIPKELMALREKADLRFKRKQQKRKTKRINYSKDERLVRFSYLDDNTPSTYFVRFITKLQEQELNAYFEDYRTRVNQLKDKLQKGEIAKDEFETSYAADFPELQTPSNFRLVLGDLHVLSFNVANNMYYSELPKDGFFDISIIAFDRVGDLLYQIDKNSTRNSSKSIHYMGSVRDSTLKISDDLGIKVNLKKLEPEVTHLLLTVDIRNLDQTIAIFNDLQYSRFRLADFITDQTVEETNIFQNFKLEELKDAGAESELGGKILCYYIYKTPELGWMVESVKSFKNVLVDTYKDFNQVVGRYLKECMDEELKEFADNPDFTQSLEEQQSYDKSVSKESKTKSSIIPSKIVESKKEEEEEEQDEVPGFKFHTANFGPLHLKVTDDLETIKEKVDEALKKEAVLYESFEYGYDILVGNNQLMRPTQIRKIGDVTSFTIKRKPKPIEEPIKVDDEDQDGSEQGDKSSVSD